MEWSPDPNQYLPHLRSRIRRGRGLRSGIDYRPWLKVRDVPSRGTSSTVPGILISRPFHLLSKLETTYFYLIERRPTTLDICEQFPILDIAATLDICRKLDVRHHYLGRNLEPFTIDFLIKELHPHGPIFRAASIKTPEDAINPDIEQGLRVEHDWCGANNIPWTLVDTSRFDDTVLENLRFMRTWFRHRFSPEYIDLMRFTEAFLESYQRNVPLNLLLQPVARKLRLQRPISEDAFRYCAWKDLIPVSLHHALSFDNPVVLQNG